MNPDLAPRSISASDKVAAHHLDRLAVVYVRQSTLQQIEHHRESTQLQYGLADRACRLGWPRPKVMIIDEDLGLSAASTEGRAGFQRLVAEVGLGHVGLVLGFEVSRLARSCRDWYHLLEICALAGTLIADNDGVYDPGLFNDRLLLGLKGTMSEAELHIMRARFEEGRWNKAERGELGFNLPRGFLRRPSGEIILDPDERVRDTLRLVFDIFERRRSAHGVVRYLAAHDVDLPDRARHGPAKGAITWRPPTRVAVLGILTNPASAGGYAYGPRATRPSPGQPEQACRGRARRPVAAGRAPGLRPMRLPHGHQLPHQRARRAVQLHPAAGEPRRSRLPVLRRAHPGRLRHRPRAGRAASLGDRCQPAAGRGHRARTDAAAPPLDLAPGAGTLRGGAGGAPVRPRRTGEPAGRADAREALGGGAGHQGRTRGRARPVHGP